MKYLSNHSDLVQFGINPLTGEACGYGMRVLCDLSAAGCALVADFMGLRFNPDDPTACFPRNWNSKVGDRPAIASFMLTRSTVSDLMRFALFSVDNCDYVLENPDGSLYGLHEGDEYCTKYLEMARTEEYHAKGYRIWTNFSKTGSRNQHAFSGRTV